MIIEDKQILRQFVKFLQILLGLASIVLIGAWFILDYDPVKTYQPESILVIGLISIIVLGCLRTKLLLSIGRVKITKWIDDFRRLPEGSEKLFSDSSQQVVNLFYRMITASGVPFSLPAIPTKPIKVLKVREVIGGGDTPAEIA